LVVVVVVIVVVVASAPLFVERAKCVTPKPELAQPLDGSVAASALLGRGLESPCRDSPKKLKHSPPLSLPASDVD
jgi:hypothetical protein